MRMCKLFDMFQYILITVKTGMIMKKWFGLVTLMLVSALIFQSNTPTEVAEDFGDGDLPKLVKYPKKVDALIKNKCYGCHSPQGKAEKARNALNWDDLASLSPKDIGAKAGAIQKVVEGGMMPPAGFLEKMPDKKLTAVEAALLAKWAKKVGKKALKKAKKMM